MSRELKFRVYIKETSRYVYFSLGDFDYSKRVANNQSDIPIEQFTGMYDKNKKPIYEGDLVNTIYEHDPYNCIGKVIYHEETASYRIKTYKNLLPIVTYRFVDDKPQGLLIVVDEVIGNKYQWPCKKPNSFDENGECLTCDCWAADCPFFKLA
jgi:uncharacterized phage protein (TIGR01671 family)